MTSWQMKCVINKNYRILYKNLIVGIYGYKLLILRKIIFSIKSDVKKFKICVSFSFRCITVFTGDMVDCHTEEKLSTSAEPRLTMLFDGWKSNMSSRKERAILFYSTKCPNFFHNFYIMLLNYLTYRATFSMNVTRCHDVAKYAAIGFSIRTARACISRSRHFFKCHPPYI